MAVSLKFLWSGALFALLGLSGAYAQSVSVIWSDATTGQILRGNLGGGGTADVLFEASDYPGAPSAVAPFGIDVDDSFVYWSDATTGQILRGSADGLGSATLLFDRGDYPGSPTSTGPSGLAVDATYVYWADNGTGQILRGNKDGSGGVTALFDASDYPDAPEDIYPWDVTVLGGQLYWTDADTSQILKAAADGSSSVQALFTSAPERVNLGLAIEDGFVYWGDTENEGLEGSLLGGAITGAGLPETLYTPIDYPGSPTSAVPTGLAALNGNLYWVDDFTKQILRASADGSGPVSVVFDMGDYPGSPAAIGPTFLAVVSTGYSADYDGDGDVDGRDFLVWQRGQSPDPLSAGDLALWKAQYGQAGPLAAVVSVPEPLSAALALVVGALGLGARRPV